MGLEGKCVTGLNGAETIFGTIRKGKSPTLELISSGILLSSIGFSIASVEMSSKFSIKNFSKDQRTLQTASDALSSYNTVGLLWSLGVTLMLYATYGKPGLIWGVISNGAVLAWINISYLQSFKEAAAQNGVKFPRALYGLVNPHGYPRDFGINPAYKKHWGTEKPN